MLVLYFYNMRHGAAMRKQTSLQTGTAPITSGPIPPAAKPQLRYRGLRAVFALIVREMVTTYGRSPGGYFWAVAQPVALIAVLSLAFSLLLRSPPLGANFTFFYATGLLPLRMFQMLSTNIGGALLFSKPLMGYPRVTFMDTIIARAILVILTQFVITIIILGGISLWVEVNAVLDFELILEAYALVILLGVGIGMLNCFLFTLMPFWRLVWGIATGPLIILSAVIYLFESLPLFAQNILWYNPLVHVTSLSRAGFFSTYHPAHPMPVYVIACAIIPAFFGMMMLHRYGRTIVYL